MRTSGTITLLSGLLILLGSSAAHARQATEKSFGGKGWNQSELTQSLALPVSFAGVSRGAFSFDLQRAGEIPFSRPETIFELVDAAGAALLRLKVSWTSDAESGHPVLMFHGEGGGGEYRRHGMGLWGPFVELDRPVAVGQKIRVDLSWDDGTRTYGVHVDGRAQTAQHGGFEPVQRRWYPDQRPHINSELQDMGRAGRFDAQPLSYFLSRVAAVQLGNFSAPGRSGKKARSLLQHALLDNVTVFVDEIPPPGLPNPPPVIDAVDHDAARVVGFSGKLVPGDTLHVTMAGSPGASGSFDVAHDPDSGGTVALDWRGWGVPLEAKPFPEEGEVNLREVQGYRVYASTTPFEPTAPGMDPAAELKVGEQSYTFEPPAADKPWHLAVVAILRDGTTRTVIAPLVGRPLEETAPGVYAGSLPIGWQDRYPRAVVVCRLERSGAAATRAAAIPFAIDASLTVAVSAEPNELSADENSRAKVTVSVTDANANPVAGHKVKLLLATTSQYTGVVGGGAFTDQVGGSLAENGWGETDLFGRVTATYVAGFAAKTAIIVARDMVSNSTGSGWVKTAITATAHLELEAVQQSAAMARGYAIRVTTSDEWLTADGKSQARISARVTLGDQPVEGHRVAFTVASGTGSLRTAGDVTDRNGVARAVYTAGKKIGVALITATDHSADVGGSVQIELRSDAPAKIAIKTVPGKLPADGRSTADLLVRVTDVNDNPSDGVEVEYLISEGGGRLRDDKGLTDRRGESATRYTAGRSPGSVAIEITVRSAVPSEAELSAARDLALAVTDPAFF
jgi:hypothetical protein